MIKELENLLYAKTLGKQSEILFAHWNYDKKIIPTALNAVSNLFPHYSLHDETHSETIINNIVRVIGFKNIEKLSAIDIWLILEACYNHDIGMVVSSEKLIEALNSNDFLNFFKDLQDDNKNGLHEFAIKFEIENNKIKYKHNDLSLDFHDGIKFILAEFFRRKHSDRSKEIILNPSAELSLTTPRGVIPNRIFKILAEICASHTKDFEDVMNLPFCEVGIDVEDAHPRFIACLLRIGDLLDLDNNRFSEVMLRTLSKIPIDTISHKSKHLAIESFRVDNERIDVVAKCSDYDTANITQHWFNYLDSEISRQMINWNNIVPFKDFGYLPTIGDLKVELINYDYLDGKQKPKFSVDTDKALSLLQGAGLYEHSYQSFREILQNAVDSTLIRIWLEHNKDFSFQSPQDKEFLNIIKNYPIKISIIEKETKDKIKKWEITVNDNGIGISTEDLKFLMKTGSSSKNRKKINIVEQMPEWLRPSGIFGIGFQSIFLLTDEVIIETKSFFNEEFQTIELNSPNSIKDGAILIQKKKTDHSIKPGVKLLIKYNTEAVPTRWTIKGEQKNAMRIAHNYDPFSHESLDINLGMIIDEIFSFEYASMIPINLIINGDIFDFTEKENNYFKYFDKVNSLELNINLGNNISSYYKNQYVENDFYRLLFLGVEVNFHKDKANDILTLNRNKLKSESSGKLFKQVLDSSFRIITNNFDEIFINQTDKQFGSMFLEYYYNENDELKIFNISKFNQWKQYKLKIQNDNFLELSSLLNDIKKIRLNFNSNVAPFYEDLYTYENSLLVINSNNHTVNSSLSQFIFSKIENNITRVIDFKFGNNDYLDFIEISLENTGEDFLSQENFIKVLKKSQSWNRTSRKIIPCPKKYDKLRLKDDANLNYLYHFNLSHYIEIKYPKMVSPYVVEEVDNKNGEERYKCKNHLNEKLFSWVFNNRYDEMTTKEEIIKTYNEFIEEFKDN
ncbi:MULTISPECIES: HD domain-containing protein [unclassified Empedobacter]|uniref:HD domain-containing protein n=1 Tax=unclassified Empedobacter TaxID=2643773 RepID=UPI0025B860D4|nr:MULTISPECIES: ATP-binding protein [unclassified Empedobacter]